MCSSLPKIRYNEQSYPLTDSPWGPASVMLELTVTPKGRAQDVVVIENDAGDHADYFSKQAIESLKAIHFQEIDWPCRGRMKIVFRLGK